MINVLNYKSDLENTYSIINNDYIDDYDKLYFSSNEDLRGIFNEMDFKGKKVLTVLASGDQVFHFIIIMQQMLIYLIKIN